MLEAFRDRPGVLPSVLLVSVLADPPKDVPGEKIEQVERHDHAGEALPCDILREVPGVPPHGAGYAVGFLLRHLLSAEALRGDGDRDGYIRRGSERPTAEADFSRNVDRAQTIAACLQMLFDSHIVDLLSLGASPPNSA
jgi:hypothetical protein